MGEANSNFILLSPLVCFECNTICLILIIYYSFAVLVLSLFILTSLRVYFGRRLLIILNTFFCLLVFSIYADLISIIIIFLILMNYFFTILVRFTILLRDVIISVVSSRYFLSLFLILLIILVIIIIVIDSFYVVIDDSLWASTIFILLAFRFILVILYLLFFILFLLFYLLFLLFYWIITFLNSIWLFFTEFVILLIDVICWICLFLID